MAEEETTGKHDPFTIRAVTVRFLADCETITHSAKKGQICELQSDHVEQLVKDGKVEILTERAVVEAATKAEKRG